MFSRAWHRLHVFPRLAPVAACFPALGIGFMFFPRLAPIACFSRAWHRLHVFPALGTGCMFFLRLAPAACFPELGTVACFAMFGSGWFPVLIGSLSYLHLLLFVRCYYFTFWLNGSLQKSAVKVFLIVSNSYFRILEVGDSAERSCSGSSASFTIKVRQNYELMFVMRIYMCKISSTAFSNFLCFVFSALLLYKVKRE